MIAASPRRPFAWPWLVCLELQREHVVPGYAGAAAQNAGVATTCARVLDFARRDGWRIVHSQRQLGGCDRPERLAAPIEGLRPLITEPVFFHRGMSAFANPAFAAEMRAARGEEVYLIGFSLPDSCLATALAGFDAGLSVALVDDAVGHGGVPSLAESARTVLAPFVRMVASAALVRSGLEVVT